MILNNVLNEIENASKKLTFSRPEVAAYVRAWKDDNTKETFEKWLERKVTEKIGQKKSKFDKRSTSNKIIGD